MTRPKRDGDRLVPAIREAMLLSPDSYQATEDQRLLKARFWTAFKHNPMCDEKDVSPALVEELTNRSVQGWMSDPKFWDWFATRKTTEVLLETAAEKAAALTLFYLDPAVPMNDNARVQLIKIAMEYSGRSPPTRKEVIYADREVQNMTDEQLEQVIAKFSRKPKPLPEKE